jgi:hypothetical protein
MKVIIDKIKNYISSLTTKEKIAFSLVIIFFFIILFSTHKILNLNNDLKPYQNFNDSLKNENFILNQKNILLKNDLDSLKIKINSVNLQNKLLESKRKLINENQTKIIYFDDTNSDVSSVLDTISNIIKRNPIKLRD